MKLNYGGTPPHTKHNTPAMCSHLGGFTEKALHFSECNKSLSIYLFLLVSAQHKFGRHQNPRDVKLLCRNDTEVLLMFNSCPGRP